MVWVGSGSKKFGCITCCVKILVVQVCKNVSLVISVDLQIHGVGLFIIDGCMTDVERSNEGTALAVQARKR